MKAAKIIFIQPSISSLWSYQGQLRNPYCELRKRIDTLTKRITHQTMPDYNKDRVDDMVLALLHLTSFSDHGSVRAWKCHDWNALDRLHEKGLIGDPKSKNKSVLLSEEGARRAEELFQKYCGS
jgi:hypothetical protein